MLHLIFLPEMVEISLATLPDDFLFPLFVFSGTSADIMKVGGYKLSALGIEAILLEASR